MDKANKKDEGTSGPGIKWNPKSVGDYKRGLKQPSTGNVADHNRPGAGQKGK